MADDHPAPSPGPSPGPPCRQLRSSGMYVHTDGRDDGRGDDVDNSLYWCMTTMKDYGPDNEQVEGRACRDPQRSCYLET